MDDEKSVIAASIQQVAEIEQQVIEQSSEMNADFMQDCIEINLDFAASIDATAVMCSRLDMSADYWKTKADQAYKISKSLERAKEFIRSHIKDAMISQEKKELLGNEHRYVLSRTKPKLSIDEAVLPKEFLKEKVTLVPDKTAIEAELEKGSEVAGAKFEPCFALRTYPNKMERAS